MFQYYCNIDVIIKLIVMVVLLDALVTKVRSAGFEPAIPSLYCKVQIPLI